MSEHDCDSGVCDSTDESKLFTMQNKSNNVLDNESDGKLDDKIDDRNDSSETGSDSAILKSRRIIGALYAIKMKRVDGAPCMIPGSNIAIGSVGSAYNIQALKEYQITHILCLADTCALPYQHEFRYKRVSMKDNCDQNVFSVLEECLGFIHDSLSSDTSRVLVHCYKGVSRSATICCAYLMVYRHVRLDDALELVRSVRPQACPNIHFYSSLRALQRDIDSGEYYRKYDNTADKSV